MIRVLEPLPEGNGNQITGGTGQAGNGASLPGAMGAVDPGRRKCVDTAFEYERPPRDSHLDVKNDVAVPTRPFERGHFWPRRFQCLVRSYLATIKS